MTVSLRSLAGDVRRSWPLVALVTCLGAALGLAAGLVLGERPVATTTLILAHDPSVEADQAMQTDIGLLNTRVLAEAVIEDLGLDATALDFLSSVTGEATTSELLTISVAAPSSTEALQRAEALAAIYLRTRAEQLGAQVESVVAANQDQLQALSREIDGLAEEIKGLEGASGEASARLLNDLISTRAGLTTRQTELRQTIQSQQIALAGVVEGSRVLDPVALEPSGAKKRAALGMVAGGFGGFMLASALVLGASLMSTRPRRRDEIAEAIGCEITTSVGSISGRRRSARRARDVLAERLAVDFSRDAGRWALLGVTGDRDAVLVAADLLRELLARNLSAVGIDLTEGGALAGARGLRSVGLTEWLASSPEGRTHVADGQPVVLRPSRVPSAARRPEGLDVPTMVGAAVNSTAEPGQLRTVVASEVSTAIGAEHIATWADTAVLVIAAGAADVDRLRAARYVVESAGFSRVFAVLCNSDPHDHSVGAPHDMQSAPRRAAGPHRPHAHPRSARSVRA